MLLRTGKALLAGGGGTQTASRTAQLFDAATGRWSPTGRLAIPSDRRPTATLLPNGKVLLLDSAGPQLYDPVSAEWTATPPTTTGRGAHTATLLESGKVLVTGGFGGSLGTAAAELYDPASNTWAATGPMIQLRYQHSAALLRDGRVIVVGGWSENYGPKRNTAELYDPDTGTWEPTGAATTAQIDATATTLRSGEVLLAGGESSDSNSNSGGGAGGDRAAQLYDPATGTWAPTGAMLSGRSLHTATLLADGKVLVGGGNAVIQVRGAEPLNNISAELYDPTAKAWVATEPLAATREAHSATLLPQGPSKVCGPNCGKVLVTGGRSLGAPGLATAELYSATAAPAETDESAAERSAPGQKRASSDSTTPIAPYLAAGALAAGGGGWLVLARRRRHQVTDRPLG